MNFRIFGLLAIAAFALAPGQSRAANLMPLASFCAQANCADGDMPNSVLTVGAKENLIGTAINGSAHGLGTVFEIAKTPHGYASTPTILYSFCSLTNCIDGAFPFGDLIADADGNLFGTTEEGGAHGKGVFVPGDGTVFEIRKTSHGYASTPTILASFCAQANCADGAFPRAGLTADADGNLFGTTEQGGASTACNSGCGTVFEIRKTPHGYASTPTILVSFNGTDGALPEAGVIADAKGNLFGTTSAGGNLTCNSPYGCGTAFEIAKTATGYATTPATLVSFSGIDGATPVANLIADAKGNLFGTTSEGGAYNGGTVFEITKTATGYGSTPITLVSFADGWSPSAGLIADAKGNLFGTTAGGGAHDGGTVFEITKMATGYDSIPTILYSFCSLTNCADGFTPVTDLTADAKGDLFGTTVNGGMNGKGGTVFEVADSGFVPSPPFAGTPGEQNCRGQSVSALAQQYGSIPAAAAARGYSSVQVLQNAIAEYCAA